MYLTDHEIYFKVTKKYFYQLKFQGTCNWNGSQNLWRSSSDFKSTKVEFLRPFTSLRDFQNKLLNPLNLLRIFKCPTPTKARKLRTSKGSRVLKMKHLQNSLERHWRCRKNVRLRLQFKDPEIHLSTRCNNRYLLVPWNDLKVY